MATMAFRQYCRQFIKEDSARGDLARDIAGDREAPQGSAYEDWDIYLSGRACSNAHETFIRVYEEYRKLTGVPKRSSKWHMITMDEYVEGGASYLELRNRAIALSLDGRKRPPIKRLDKQVYEYTGPDDGERIPTYYIGTREGLASIEFRDLDSMEAETWEAE